MGIPKQHHYLPEFYLENFCDKKGFWVYDKKLHKLSPQTPHNTCKKKNLYMVIGSDGNNNYDLEHFYSAMIDSNAAPIIKKRQENKELDIEEFATLCLILPYMMVRVPGFYRKAEKIIEIMAKHTAESIFSNNEMIEDWLKQHFIEEPIKAGVSSRELYSLIKNNAMLFRPQKGFVLGSLIKLAHDLYPIFWNLEWHFNWAPSNTRFITSDQPFVVIPPGGNISIPAGILTPGAISFFPVCSNCCIALQPGNHGVVYRRLSRPVVTSINECIMDNCVRFAIATHESQLRKLVKSVFRKKLQPN